MLATPGHHLIDQDDLATITPYIRHAIRRLGDPVLDLNPPAAIPTTRLDLEPRAGGSLSSTTEGCRARRRREHCSISPLVFSSPLPRPLIEVTDRGEAGVLFAGDDWAEDHHDIELQDEAGRVLARARLPEGIAGITRLHALIGQFAGPGTEPR